MWILGRRPGWVLVFFEGLSSRCVGLVEVGLGGGVPRSLWRRRGPLSCRRRLRWDWEICVRTEVDRVDDWARLTSATACRSCPRKPVSTRSIVCVSRAIEDSNLRGLKTNLPLRREVAVTSRDAHEEAVVLLQGRRVVHGWDVGGLWGRLFHGNWC